MRLKTLSLKNFQSHKNSVLSLSPGFNLIIGSSNDGKSSIVRSLECFLYSDWDVNYVTIGEAESVISGTLEDNSFLEKTKGKGVNKFSITTPDTELQEYSGFGDDLPPHIIKKLGSHPIILDDDKKLYINIAAQHDSIFLLNESGSLRAKIIGYISGVHLIDSVVRETTSEVRNINSILSDLETEKFKVEERISSYAAKESDFSKIDELEEWVKEQESIVEKVQQLNSVLVSCRNYNAKVMSLKGSISQLDAISEIEIRDRFTNLMIELKTCPFCGSGLEKESVSKHLCNAT